MRFEIILPAPRLRPYVKHLVISESILSNTYKIFPSTGLVIGFQYRGTLFNINGETKVILATAGITGLHDRYKIFRNEANTGTILVVFNETGAAHFFKEPVHELFAQSVSLDNFMKSSELMAFEDRLSEAKTDDERIKAVENFLILRLSEKKEDLLVATAIAHIKKTGGTIRIKDLNNLLHTSQSPLEKRFRTVVGTSPKKFASIVRFNAVMHSIRKGLSFNALEQANNYFDQAHFIKDFKNFTGETPERFIKGKP